MKKIIHFIFILLFLVGASACTKTISMTYQSNPAGATIESDGTVRGEAPVTVEYPLEDKNLETSSVTARWKSGATQTSHITLNPQAGTEQVYTFQRPNTPDSMIDQKYATELEKRLKKQKKLERIKNNPHSLEAIIYTIQLPIPESMITQGRQVDDTLMKQGTDGSGNKIYLVTDSRATRVNQITDRILQAMGKNKGEWTVRVFDTNPKIENAFVVGGKYIYVFTGLIENANSDDELAFVLSHEIGHSVLKHYLREKSDPTLSLVTSLATIIGAFSKYKAEAAAVSKSFVSSYSRIDEEEADAFGAAAARRAGYDPIRGVNFFVRMERMQDAADQRVSTAVQKLKVEYEQAQALCTQWRNAWNSRPNIRTQENATQYNSACDDAQVKYSRYSQLISQVNAQKKSAGMSDHPSNQNRIAAIAALSDFLDGKRDIDSLKGFQQSQRVMMALSKTNSTLLKPAAKPIKPKQRQTVVPNNAGAMSMEKRLEKLDSLHNKGVITDAEFKQKRQDILNSL